MQERNAVLRPPMAPKFKRRRKLILAGLQLRMSGVFVGLVTLMLGLQFVLLTSELHHAANELPSDGGLLLERAAGVATRLIVVSAAIFLPLTLLVGILSTFRIAGPLYRFQRFLEATRDGAQPDDFRLRDKDELHELAALLNDATRPLREEPVEEKDAVDEGDSLAA